MNPLRLAVVGSGFRTGLHLDLVARVPHLVEVTGVLVRSSASAERVRDGWGVPVVTDLDDLLAAGPTLVLTSLPASATTAVTAELVARGRQVLVETPPAPDLAGLRGLWAAVGASGRVQVAEQYPWSPHNAARRGVVRAGLLGEVTSVQVSSTQTYHATSLVRGLLGVGAQPARVVATATTAPLANPVARPGWTDDDTAVPQTTTLATFAFGDGRSALYDFTDSQTRNPLRARRMVVRGSLGELVDDRLVRLAGPRTVLTSTVERRETGRYQDVQGHDLDHLSLEGRVVFRNPFVGARLMDEEIAVLSLLLAAGDWARGEGPAPYPLAEAAQDQVLGLAVGESLRTGGPVTTSVEPWAATLSASAPAAAPAGPRTAPPAG